MGKKLNKLAARVTALEKIVAGMLASKISIHKKAKHKKAKKAIVKSVISTKTQPPKRRSESTAPKATVAAKPATIVRAENPVASAPVEPAARPQPAKPAAVVQRTARLPTTGGQSAFPILSKGKTN